MTRRPGRVAPVQHRRPVARPPLRGTGTLLALFALLVQLWLPWVHQPAQAAAADLQVTFDTTALSGAGVLDDAHALCLAPGDQDRPATPGKAPAPKVLPCPVCQTLHQLGSFVPPAEAATLAEPPVAAPGSVPAAQPSRARPPVAAAQPRAPPGMA